MNCIHDVPLYKACPDCPSASKHLMEIRTKEKIGTFNDAANYLEEIAAKRMRETRGHDGRALETATYLRGLAMQLRKEL